MDLKVLAINLAIGVFIGIVVQLLRAMIRKNRDQKKLRYEKEKKQEETNKRVLAKRKNVLKFEEIEVDVGRTLVEYFFKDGRSIEAYTYGKCYQRYDEGNDESLSSITETYYDLREPYAGQLEMLNSLKEAQLELNNFAIGPATVVDDVKNPKICLFGEVISKKIIGTESYSEPFIMAVVKERS